MPRKAKKEYTVTMIPAENGLTREQAYDRLIPIIEKMILRSEMEYSDEEIDEMYEKLKLDEKYGSIDQYFK
jgi:hypothetical protein